MQLNSGKASPLEKVNPQMFSTSFSLSYYKEHNGEIALNMHESKAPPMGQSHVTKSELMPHPPPSTAREGGVGA